MGRLNIDSRCPKCGGKIIIEKDMHGWYEQCLQCSYLRDLVEIGVQAKQPVRGQAVQTAASHRP